MGVFLSSEERREQEALEWVQVLHSDAVSDAQMEAYLTWMDAHERNAELFQELDAAWVLADEHADAIRARFGPEARAGRATLSDKIAGFFRPGWTPQFAAFAGLVLIAGVFALDQPEQGPAVLQQFATVVGEQREVALADGSVVTLNTGSRITVNLTSSKRTVTLASGGALFDVAPDADRPFIVRMDEGAVEVLGTVFDVLRKPEGFAVTVVEGRVSVSADVDGPLPNTAVVLTPNQGAEVNTRLASLTPHDVDAATATAWQRGQLIYREALLIDVLVDIARYSEHPVSLSSGVPEGQSFTGVLTIEAPGAMINRLASLLQLEAVSDEDGSLRLQPVE